MLLRIETYVFTVKYVPGKDMPIADGLSRLPIHGDEILDIDVTMLVKIHTGHKGIDKCRLRARETMYWCGINVDIDNMIRKCDVRQHNQTSQPNEEMIPIDSTYPWGIVGSDMFHFRGKII